MVIGAGLPSLLDDPVFEKFSRISQPINLKGMLVPDLLDLIFKPLQELGNYTRYEVQRWFNPLTIKEIIDRSGGNPLHVKILCEEMFAYVKHNPSTNHFELNGYVMNKVMEYYSRISEKSRKINLSLESCSRYQLDSFKLLYKYEGFSIRAALLLELAFNPINQNQEEPIRLKLIDAFEDLFDFGLFDFSQPGITMDHLKNMSSIELSQIEYKFIGDPIDKLYASYFFELTQGQKLYINQGETFEDILANRFGQLLDLSIVSTDFPHNYTDNLSKSYKMIQVLDGHVLQNCQGKQVVDELDKLVELSKDTNNSKSDQNIKALSERHNLNLPSYVAKFMDFKGYYVIISDLTIKGKQKYVYNLFPVMSNATDIVEIKKEVTDISHLNISLSDYMVVVNYIYVLWLPCRPLIKIYILDMENEYHKLVCKVRDADYDPAAQIAHRMCNKSSFIYEGQLVTQTDMVNNYGFCLINIGKIPEAVKVLKACYDKSVISRANLAYAYFLQGNYSEAKSILSKMVRKKMGINYQTTFMHLAINHPELKNKHKIVEDCNLFSIIAWNAALISAHLGDDITIVNSFFKKAIKRNHEVINKRVESWIKYIKGDIDDSIRLSQEIINNYEDNSGIKDSINQDLKIFEKQLHANHQK